MKAKHQKILLESSLLVGKIPSVSMMGATATASVYVSAYHDYNEACKMLGNIACCIKQIDSLEVVINKYKHDKDEYDMDDLRTQVEFYENSLNKSYSELKDFISEREEQDWS